MTDWKPPYKVGEAFRLEDSPTDGSASELTLDRQRLGGLSPKLKTLFSGELVVTALPGWRALCVYSWERWEALVEQLQELPGLEPEARYIQRALLGHAAVFDEQAPVVLDRVLMARAALPPAELVVIVFDDQNAELWSEAQLAEIADEATTRE